MVRTTKPKPLHIPAYCLHKPTGQAYVTLNGKMIYLGKFKLRPDGFPDCPEYHRRISAWLAGTPDTAAADTPTAEDPQPFTVLELIAKYWEHVEGYYKGADGQPTGERVAIQHALRPLKRLFGGTTAAEFGPKRLKLVRDEMVRMGWCRTNVNRQISRVIRCFSWGVQDEKFPATNMQALREVDSLRANPDLRESTPVRSAPKGAVDVVVAVAPKPIAALIELQRLTGMRPGEAVAMRFTELDITTTPWAYRPATHKNAYRNQIREIHIGPKARKILEPFLSPKMTGFIFHPDDAERYTVTTYRRALTRACDRAFALPPELEAAWEAVTKWQCKWAYAHHDFRPRLRDYPKEILKLRNAVEAFRKQNRFHPHQLRHSAATAIRNSRVEREGVHDAQAVLGHAAPEMTEQYVDENRDRSRQVMELVG